MKDEVRYNRWTEFLEQYKDYFNDKNFDYIWHKKFNNLKKFIDDNKKRPSCKSKSQEEKLLVYG